MSDPTQDKRNPLAWYEKAHDLMADPMILRGGVTFAPTVAAALAAAYREGTEWKPLLEVKRHPAQVPAPVYPGQPFPEYPGQVITVVETRVEELQRQVDELKAALWKIGARGHSEDCLFCGFKDAIAKEALDKP